MASTIAARVAQSARQDPKKVGLLVVLTLGMILAWGKLLVGGGGGPASAVASPDSGLPRGSLAGQSDNGRIFSSNGSSLGILHEWSRLPVGPMERNLFAVRLDYFPRDADRSGPGRAEVAGDAFWDQLAKSMSSQADQRRERQVLVENLRRQAGQLRLQTTIMGDKPKALIDGELVGEGDVVASFRVLRIESRRIIVEREGVLLEIPMR